MTWIIVAFVIWVVVSASVMIGMLFRMAGFESDLRQYRVAIDRLERLHKAKTSIQEG